MLLRVIGLMVKEIENNKVWAKEAKHIRGVQLSFHFDSDIDLAIRVEAAKKSKKPSDVVRDILGFDSKPMSYVRLGVSFSDEELEILSEKFSIPVTNKTEIKKRVATFVTKELIKKGM